MTQFQPPFQPKEEKPPTGTAPEMRVPKPSLQPWYPPPQQYWLPPQGYLPGPVSPHPRPVRQGVKVAAISVFAVGAFFAYAGGIYGLQLASVCGLISFILMFFI